MRIWSMHPGYLDRIGLVACWRETLLAQKVLAGGTRGYRNHPQLARFQGHADPLAAVGAYLAGLHAEAGARGYSFNGSLILVPPPPRPAPIELTRGQLAHEFAHLRAKLAGRSPGTLDSPRWRAGEEGVHPLFHLVDGPVAGWERV
ncbi:pyrimidine dimer DNA glycosylase/endonuclease V [Corynebacterium sphenisci]|uniref:pyrimidine dimer DNA glycosylase/endonuclease V n=1 Tax=Corynebacterium sphenisci TaxID=191493 RepID=UPI0026E0FAC0|nr:pyrimidine dimer DNA glycosylase/endonuclease V [Corynebacterium sphenisci]MDO5730657.1 pyrimidine dimer DNA glycosylase/endonuclease V [Corynebacterium sphenisci]